MILQITHNLEYVNRLKIAMITTSIIGGIICAFSLINTTIAYHQLNQAKTSLNKTNMQYKELSKQLVSPNTSKYILSNSIGGVEVFAVNLTRSARSGGVKITTIVPEGMPVSNDIEINGLKLGKWTSSKIRAKGNARFADVLKLMKLLSEFSSPVELKSFLISSSSRTDEVIFELVLIVYEKQREVN